MTLTEYRCSIDTNNNICFKHCKGSNELAISFKRTIRVPDNGKASYLPPSIGNFQLFRVKDYINKLPPAMVAKGGLFLPMYQSEAMWIHFHASAPFMIKIYCGGINVVSSEHANEDMSTRLRRQNLHAEKNSLQDYVVVPNQQWIDGIATKPGYVKQFVAMPNGMGYSVEAQLTGKETTGGLQFEITPAAKINIPLMDFASEHLPLTSTPSEMKEPSPTRIRVYVKTLTGKFSDKQDKEGISIDQQRILLDSMQLEDGRKFFDYSKFKPDCAFYLVIRLRGGGDPSRRGTEMGIAAGGLIEQTIVEDTYPRTTWNSKLTTTFNVQILNSAAFQQVTGRAPPETPITAETYASSNMPFFKMWEESSPVHKLFDKVKSVAEIDGIKEAARKYPLVHLAADGSLLVRASQGFETQTNELIDDPHGIINEAGTLREFRTVHDLVQQVDGMPFVSFDSDEEMT